MHPDPGAERGAALHHHAAAVRGAHHQALHLPQGHHAAPRAASAHRSVHIIIFQIIIS